MTDKFERSIEGIEVMQARVFRDLEAMHHAAGALRGLLLNDDRLTRKDVKRISAVLERTRKIRAAALAADGRSLPEKPDISRGLRLPEKEYVQSYGRAPEDRTTAHHARGKRS